VFVSETDAQGLKQVNAMVPMGMEPGEYFLTVRARKSESRQVPIRLVET